MDKLLNLLNGYGKTLAKGTRIPAGNYKDIEKNKLLIISREYGFIKWLVDNDKIKMELLKYNYMDLRELVREADMVVMLLAISDTPIDDLISYLR